MIPLVRLCPKLSTSPSKVLKPVETHTAHNTGFWSIRFLLPGTKTFMKSNTHTHTDDSLLNMVRFSRFKYHPQPPPLCFPMNRSFLSRHWHPWAKIYSITTGVRPLGHGSQDSELHPGPYSRRYQQRVAEHQYTWAHRTGKTTQLDENFGNLESVMIL